jgi:hypothetical protein
VESAEQEILIGELELRIDRLRSLYEQYFMGIERLEPSVPRKDVERRVQILRKEQIRNSGMRFRFQMLLQKYNTYQTYWQRICREMEAGTYKRHVVRARARFAREGETALDRAKKAGEKAGAVPPPPLSSLELERLAFDDFGLDEPPSSSVDVAFGTLEDPFERPDSAVLMLAAKPVRSPMAPAPKAPSAPSVPIASSIPASSPREPVASSQAGARVWRKAPPAAPRGSGAPEPRSDPPQESTSSVQPFRAAPPAAPQPDAASSSAMRASPPAVPRPATMPGAQSSSVVRSAVPAPPPPRVPNAPAPRQAPARALAPAPAPAPANSASLSEDRVRQLYSQYVETKRRHNESTAAITYDGLAKSLRESSAKLREKLGKNVDFEVTVKDGKTVLKPVVK